MWEIFEKLLKSKGCKVSDVASGTGINNAFFSDWKKGKKKDITTSNAIKIAKFFNVSLEYLTTGEEPKLPQYDSSYIELINDFSKLSEENKTMIKNLIKQLREE